MTAVASVVSVALFLAFLAAGVQKVLFNPVVSAAAGRLGFTKKSYQRIGLLEIVGGVGIVVGLYSRGPSWRAVVSEVAAAALVTLMGFAVYYHVRARDSSRVVAPALTLGLVALVDLLVRLRY